MLILTKTVYSLTTRVEGSIDTAVFGTEQEACQEAYDNILESYDYDGPLTLAAINIFMEGQQGNDGYDELVITEHSVELKC